VPGVPNWVNQTAGSSVALIAVKFSGRRWLPLALLATENKTTVDNQSEYGTLFRQEVTL